MVHTKNDKYRLIYIKGHWGYSNGSKYWIRTKWTVKNLTSKIVWSYEGKLFNSQKSELLEKFKLNVKTN